MSSYGILRIEKIKASSGGELFGRLKHSFRQFDYQNEQTKNNKYFGNSADSCFSEYKRMTENCEKRKDSVGSFEVVLTSSERPDWKKKDYEEYLKKAVSWTLEKFGEKNCFGVVIHYDEKIPHAHLFFSPVETVEKKKKQTKEEREKGIQRTEKVTQLNAKKFFNGKDSLRKLQTDFFEKVSKSYGFERGELAEETHRTHQRITLENEIKRYEKLSEDLKKQIKISKGVEMRLKLFQSTLMMIPNMKKNCSIAEIFNGLSEEQAKKVWQKVRIYAEEMKTENQKSNVNENVKTTKKHR